MILLTIIGMILVVSYHLLKKHNPIALMEDKPLQPNVFNITQWTRAFCYVEYKILKELFLNMVFLKIWGSIIEKIKNGNNFFFLAI